MKILLKVFLVLFITSCSTPNLPPEHKELILIDVNNPDVYTFSDLRDLNMGWVELPNGNIEEGDRYQFWIEGNTVKIQSRQAIKKAEFFQDTLDHKGEELALSKEKNYIEGKLSENGIIRIIY
jgi:hypothetical protein